MENKIKNKRLGLILILIFLGLSLLFIIQFIPAIAFGVPSDGLSFFLSLDSAFAGNNALMDSDDFGETPLLVNDYGTSDEKCATWNCPTWTLTGTKSGAYCTGGWDCKTWNGVTCGEYTCLTWASSTIRRYPYCSGSWNCTAWNGTTCDLWKCTTFTEPPNNDGVAYCSGIMTCDRYNGLECAQWRCNTWTTTAANFRKDEYCLGNWTCLNVSGTSCQKWNCTGGFTATAGNNDAYCSNGWNCTNWINGFCSKWSCLGRTPGGTVNRDYYCQGWNCSSWNETSRLCNTWSCSGGWANSATEAYCSSSFNCTTWKIFIDAPNVTLVSPSDGNISSSNSTNFTCGATTKSTLKNITFYWNVGGSFLANGTTLISGTINQTQFNRTASPDGNYTWNCFACDILHNCNFSYQNRTFSVDTAPPSFNFITPTENSGSYVPRRSILVNLTSSEVNIKNMSIYLYNSTRNLINSTNTSSADLFYNFSVGADGIYYFNSTAYNTFGLFNSTETRNVTIDTVKPLINFSSPSESSGTLIVRTNIVINISANDTNLKNLTIFLYNSAYALINSTTTLTSPNFVNITGLANGLYFFNATAYDLAGNLNSTETRNVTIDTIKPAVNFSSPSEISGTYLARTSILINVTASDLTSGLKNLTITLYNSTYTLINATNLTTSPNFVNITGLPNGLYFFNATAYDLAGNLNSTETRNVTIDTIYPLVDYGTGTLANLVNVSQTSIYVNLSVTESNEANVTFRLYNSTSVVNTTTLSAGIRTINWTGLPNGVYTYNATVIDLALNSNTSVTRTITLDSNAPSATLSTPTNASYLNASSNNYTASLTDNLGIKNATLNIYNQTALVNQTTTSFVPGTITASVGVVVTLIDNVYNWFYSLFDWAGNNFVSSNNTVTIDTINPGINFTSPTDSSGSYLARSHVVVNISVTDINLGYSFVNFDRSLVGWFKLEERSGTSFQDSAGFNTGSCFGVSCPSSQFGKFGYASYFDSINNYLDFGTASLLNFNSSTNNYTFSTWINLAGKGSDGLGNTILGKFASGNGYKFYVYNDSRGLFFQSDGTNLTSNYVLNYGTWYNVLYTKNGSGQYLFVNGVQVANSSVATLSPSSSNFYIATSTNPPVGLFNGSIDEVLIFNRSLGSNEILSLYDSSVNKYLNNFTNLFEGLHTFKSYAIDVAGNFNSTETRNVTIDTVKPLINFTSPTENSGIYLNRNNIRINVTASDTNLLNLTITLYNSTYTLINVTNLTTSPNFVNITGLANGLYFFNATAYDLAGNFNSTETRNVTIDTIYPLVDYGIGTLANLVNVSQTSIYVNLSVTEINEANVTFRLYNSTGLVNTTTLSAGIRTINWTGLPNGVYTYNATVIDLALNSNTSVTRTITLDSNAPSATLNTPANASYLNTSSNNYTASLTDNLGIKNATLNIYNQTALVNQTTTSFVPGTITASVGVVVTLIDNVYNWFYSLFDWAGNNFVSSNNTVTIDTVNPGINFTSPTDNSGSYSARSNVLVNVTANDINSKNLTVNLYNSSGLVNSTITLASSNFINLTGLANGIYFFNATSCDYANYCNSTETRNVTIDTIKSLINFTSPTENSGIYLNRNNIRINVTASDTNLLNLTITLYNSTYTLINATNLTTSPNFVNITGLPNGLYFFNTTVYDLAGNLNSTETRNVTIDTIYPLVDYGIGTLANLVNVSQTSIYVNLTVTESNEANVTFRLYNSTDLVNSTTLLAGIRTINWTGLPNGVYTYNATVIDLALNSNTSVTRTITLDSNAPSATLNTPANASYLNTSSNNYTASLTDNLGIKNATLNIYNQTALVNQTTTSFVPGTITASVGVVVNLVDTVYNWFYSLFDWAGNNFVSSNNTVTIDTTRSLISIVGPLNQSYANSTILVNITTNDTNLASIWFNWNGTNQVYTSPVYITFSQGSNRLLAYSNDSAGNVNFTNVTFFVDSIAPNINIISPTAQTYGTNNLTLNISTLGASYVWYNWNGTNQTYSGETFVFFANGTNTLLAYANDTLGNINRTNITFVINNSLPIINFISPLDGLYYSNATRLLNLSSNGQSTWYNWNGTNQTYTTPVYIVFVEGSNKITAYANNTAGLANNYFVNFTIDTIKPLINFTSPTENSGIYLNRNNIRINVTGTDTNLLNVTATLYNSTYALINSTTTLTSPNFVNITGLANGLYFFNTTAYDLAGNLNSTETRNVTIDTIYPLVDYGTGTLANLVNVSQTSIYVNLSVTEINEANVTFRLYNSTSLVNTTTLSAGIRTINWTGLPNGVYTYNATIIDLALNSNTSVTRTITLDSNAPSATLNTPANASYLNASSNNYTASLTDNIGIKNATLNIYNQTALVNQTTTSFVPGAITASVGVVVNLVDTVYNWFYSLFDWAGNNFVSSNNTVTIDTVNPGINFTSPTDNSGSYSARSNVLVNVTANDINSKNLTVNLYNSSGLVSTSNFLTNISFVNFTIIANGLYFFNATSCDYANYCNSTETRNVTIDTVKPLINFTSPTENSGIYLNHNSILVNITSSDVNLLNITFGIYDIFGFGDEFNYSFSPFYNNYTSLSEGILFFNATAYDLAGNLNSTETRNVTIDTIYPLVDYGTGTLANLVNVSQTSIYVNLSVTEINEANVTFRLYNSTDLVNLTNFVAGIRTINWTGLPNGVYTYNATVIDLALNSNTSVTRTITLDSNAPSATLNTPANASYLNASSNNYTASLTDNLGIKNATLNIYNQTALVNQTTTSFVPGTITASVGVVVTLIDNVYNWFYSLFDWAGNNFVSSNNTVTIDTTYPLVDYGTGTLANLVNVSQTSIYVNLSVTESNEANVTFRLYNSTSLVNSTTFLAGTRTINWSNLSSAIYYYNVSVYDLAGNTNITSTRTVTISSIPPSISDISYSPNTFGDLDPGINVTFNATIIPYGLNLLDSVIFEYYNGTGWNNLTMNNISSNIYQANITSINHNTNYSYFVYANDTFGNMNQSSFGGFESAWDCTWTISPLNFGAIIGFNEQKNVGRISINNTGDPEFDNNNCTINFKLDSNLAGRISADGLVLPDFFSLDAKNNETINLNATLLTSAGSESVIITATDQASISSNSSLNSTATLITTNSTQPYLFQLIDSASNVQALNVHNFSISGYFRNLVGDGSILKAAYDVNFNWSLPSSFLIKNGNSVITYPSINDNQLHYNSLNISFNSTNLPSMIPGTYTLYLSVSGFNYSGSPIVHAGNVTTLLESVNVTLTCSNVSDGVYVTFCGTLDGDYVAPSPIITSSSGTPSSSGGSRLVDGGITAPAYEETLEVLRGDSNSFEITVKNKYPNSTLRDLKLTVSGYPEKYVTIIPNQIKELSYGKSYKFKVVIRTPTYTDYQELPLIGTITGNLVSREGSIVSYSEQHNVLLIITEVTKQQASNKIDMANEVIMELKLKGYNTAILEKELANAKQYFDNKKYKLAKLGAENVLSLKQKSEDTNNLLRRVLSAAKDPKQNYLLIGDVTQEFTKEDNRSFRDLFLDLGLFASSNLKDNLDLAIVAFERGDYSLAQERASKSLEMLILERKGNPLLFVYLYWQYILLGLILVSLIGLVGYRKMRVININAKIGDSIVEEDNLMKLSKQNQQSYFTKNLSPQDYRARRNDYDERRAKLKQIRIQLRNKRIHLLKAEEIIPNLDKEKNNLEQEIKGLQQDFYKFGKISKEEYEKDFVEFNDRLAEIEDERVTLQISKTKENKKSLYRHIKDFFKGKRLKDKDIKFSVRGANIKP